MKTRKSKITTLTCLIYLVSILFMAGCQSKTTTEISFSRDIQPIFSANCVTCHQRNNANAGLILTAGAAFENLVNVPSTESSLVRISPGSPDKSYLFNKVRGTQNQAGGSGLRMPANAPSLPQAQINLIQQWIAAGAPDN